MADAHADRNRPLLAASSHDHASAPAAAFAGDRPMTGAAGAPSPPVGHVELTSIMKRYGHVDAVRDVSLTSIGASSSRCSGRAGAARRRHCG